MTYSMVDKKDKLVELMEIIQVFKNDMETAYLTKKYEIIELRINPKDYFELKDAVMVHSIFGIDLTSLIGVEIKLDKYIEKPQISLGVKQ